MRPIVFFVCAALMTSTAATAEQRMVSIGDRKIAIYCDAWDRTWREFQQDLAKRSPRGEFRPAQASGHFIHQEQPELVVQAIKDLVHTR